MGLYDTRTLQLSLNAKPPRVRSDGYGSLLWVYTVSFNVFQSIEYNFDRYY